MSKADVYRDIESWPCQWFWITSPNDVVDVRGHGGYPWRWVARLSARLHGHSSN
jgi:hypothetical protein